jgi:hypothetical protein
MFRVQEVLTIVFYVSLFALGLDACPIEGQALMGWSLPHKLVAARMRILLNFWLDMSLSARQHHACFQKCNRNSGCRCLCKSLGRLLCTHPYPPLGASEVSGESWLFMMKMMLWYIVSDTDIAYDGVHSGCLSFGFAGTDTMVHSMYCYGVSSAISYTCMI